MIDNKLAGNNAVQNTQEGIYERDNTDDILFPSGTIMLNLGGVMKHMNESYNWSYDKLFCLLNNPEKKFQLNSFFHVTRWLRAQSSLLIISQFVVLSSRSTITVHPKKYTYTHWVLLCCLWFGNDQV